MKLRQIIITATVLFLFAAVGALLVAMTFEGTREQIAANEREALLRKLHVLIDPGHHDNAIFEDTIQVHDEQLLGSSDPITVYRARKAGEPVALVITAVAPDGYSGTIKLLVGINLDGSLAGVRTLAHRETPGLGDKIETERSDWILGFTSKSLDNPPIAAWRVKRDGGAFDQLTGATITPRAVVKAVRNSLIYYRDNRKELFADSEDNTQTQTSSPDEAQRYPG
ncbi:MAG: electron transport complex subunit RsxG [Pseudomonadota bacterium]